MKDYYGHLNGYLICALIQLVLLIKWDLSAKIQSAFLNCDVSGVGLSLCQHEL